jgi:hypothetical protein
MKWIIVIAAAFSIALFESVPAEAELISGVVDIYGRDFDFSAQKSVVSSDSADVGLGYDGCWYPIACFGPPVGANLIVIQGKTLGEVCAPPENPVWQCLGGNHDDCPWGDIVYIVHTKDGYWVKFAFVEGSGSPACCRNIRYFFQTDGSFNLCPVPVEPSTWGEIKALYE